MWLCVEKYLIFTESIFELKYANIVTVNSNKSLSLFTFISVSILRIDLVITFIRIKENKIYLFFFLKSLFIFNLFLINYIFLKIYRKKLQYRKVVRCISPDDRFWNQSRSMGESTFICVRCVYVHMY